MVGTNGNLYVTDNASSSSYIRRITPEGVVTTIAGGSLGHADGTGQAAKFGLLGGIAADANGNLYVTDSHSSSSSYIRRITPGGVVTTIAGGSQGHADGTGQAAQFYIPTSITADANGNLFVTDGSHNSIYIRKIE